MRNIYHEGSRKLQKHFTVKPLADRLAETIILADISLEDQAFISEQNMFFMATVDAEGSPNCSYKGGGKGFVKVIDENTLAFPSFDGNSMFLSMGNILQTNKIGMLFIDFERQARLRINGCASIDLEDPLLQEFHEAELVVRVKVEQIFPNCPRYIHKMKMVEKSKFVPNKACKTPEPDWKRLEAVADVLPEKDKHLAGNEQDRFKAINR
ncbi:pyridoxamine 5'-phosphate oxidase family protein [Methylophaga thalassica]|uniref:pyridoxamine 5'-phosphate oxidase family protein n=1 Tax=Methylophaga thalassica TaxID=40223 RepID=UPI002E7B4EBC|nr:pyridoxamine 5'-phosphate oxidase family protein [Methylophaga thalassica]WVI86433.1 pyridoxamine 5'-phosphate oxidase family protein [Methylophaga thalassica]